MSSEYLIRPGTQQTIIAEYDSRRELFGRDSGRQPDVTAVQVVRHGDQIFADHKCSNGAITSVLFLRRWPQCLIHRFRAFSAPLASVLDLKAD